ncbi:MAG: hypothetical protein IJW60_05440 [Clostridia bacterium]|nr:hypothetical protein [Clostridia bacterium]
MKALIWIGCIVGCAFIMTVTGMGQNPLLATLLFAGSCALATNLSKNYDKTKRKKKEKDEENINNDVE